MAVLARADVLRNAGSFGGGVYVMSASLTLSNLRVELNSATEQGGGIILVQSMLWHHNVVIHKNSAANGGGISTADGSAVRGQYIGSLSRVWANKATVGGGAVSVANQFLVADLLLLGNLAPKGAGAFCKPGASGDFNNLIVTNNDAGEGDGGAVYVGGGSSSVCGSINRGDDEIKIVTVRNCSLTHNSATRAGALFVSLDVIVSIQGSKFISNRATANGGAVMVTVRSILTVNLTWFVDNEATKVGGAAFVSDDGVLLLYNSVITNNRARHGGGVSLFGSKGEAHGSSFWANSAQAAAGALYVESESKFTLVSCSFQSNNALQSGGAVQVDRDSSLSCTLVLFERNTANSTGGGVSLGDGSLMFQV
jgi:hypothetical protein